MLLSEISFEQNGAPFECLQDAGTSLLRMQCLLLENALAAAGAELGDDGGEIVRVQRDQWETIMVLTATIRELIEAVDDTLGRLSSGEV